MAVEAQGLAGKMLWRKLEGRFHLGELFVRPQNGSWGKASFRHCHLEGGPTEGVKRTLFGSHVDVRTLSKEGRLKEVLHILDQGGILAESKTYVCLLQGCINMRALAEGKQLHGHILRSRFTSDRSVMNTLITMYAKCGHLQDARRVFDEMVTRDVVSWTAMIAGYAQHGHGEEALKLYEQMRGEGVLPNRVTFICVLNGCARIGALKKGREVHADIEKAGLQSHINLENALVDMYAKCGSVLEAHAMFNKMATRDAISWNVLIAGYARSGYGEEALKIYDQMQGKGVIPNRVTFISVLNACASLGSLEEGKRVHSDIKNAGIASNIKLENTLVDMYAKCGSLQDARQVFNKMAPRDVVSWNAMIAGYAQHGHSEEALKGYGQMQQEGVMPNRVTFVCVLNVCARLGALTKGKQVHADIRKAGIVSYIILENTLVDMYAKCGNLQDARQVFDKMAIRDVVSWSAMIAGYAQHGHGDEALNIFDNMQREGVMPNRVTFICLVSACASLGALEKGKRVHADIIKSEIGSYLNLDNALVDMYAKCGSVNDARQVFDTMVKRDVVSWNGMIAGYAQHGFGTEALQLYEQMQHEGFKPNAVTFTSVLSACSHMGLVDEGCQHYDSISRYHGLTPTVEHFGCMVDLLARAGLLGKAEDFLNKMPIKPDAPVWGALLGACRIYGNVEAAERAAKVIIKWDPQHAPLKHL